MAKSMKFEDAMKRLEEVVEKMESGKTGLEESLDLFEEGIKLVRFCSGKLEEAKKKIEILVKEGGKIKTQPFVSEKEVSDN